MKKIILSGLLLSVSLFGLEYSKFKPIEKDNKVLYYYQLNDFSDSKVTIYDKEEMLYVFKFQQDIANDENAKKILKNNKDILVITLNRYDNIVHSVNLRTMINNYKNSYLVNKDKFVEFKDMAKKGSGKIQYHFKFLNEYSNGLKNLIKDYSLLSTCLFSGETVKLVFKKNIYFGELEFYNKDGSLNEQVDLTTYCNEHKWDGERVLNKAILNLLKINMKESIK